MGRSLHVPPHPCKTTNGLAASHWISRLSLSVVVCATALAVSILQIPAAYASCWTNSGTWCDYSACPEEDQYPTTDVADNFLVKIATQSGPCTSNFSCPYSYLTQGGKGNLTTDGLPYDHTTRDHVASWIGSREHDFVSSSPRVGCQTGGATGAGGCWVQVGWTVGYGSQPPQPTTCQNPHSIDTGGVIKVYVEIYDDSANPCLLGTWGVAPSIASYDARYYSTLSNGLHRYQVYYQAPGGSIQNLAFADFADQKTVEEAAGEVHSVHLAGQTYPACPVLGRIANGDWNTMGKPYTGSPSLFAGPMNLYTGSWTSWTNSASGVASQVDYLPMNSPYQFRAVSNVGAGDFTQWQHSGGQP